MDEEPWRLHATTRQPFGRMAAEVFEDDPAATGVLAVIGDLADPDGSSTLIAAAREAAAAGSLVVITPAAGLAGFCASLQAEHPSLGITLIRTADSMAGLLAAQRFAATEPGRFRELVLDAVGAPREPVMVATPAPDRTPPRPDGGAASQPPGRAAGVALGRSDVVLVSGGQPGDVLATAQLLAGSGARLALVGGPARPAEVTAVDLALASLRRAGTVVSYATADISDPDQAEAVVARIEEQAGPVTAVCYQSSSGLRAGCTELPAGQVRALISAQADGLSNLLGAISAARLRLLLTVSALPARYGAARHGAASLSAAALAEQARRLGQGLPGCRVLHADLPWPPGSGPAAPAELGGLLMNTLAHQAAATRIAIHGRLGRGTGTDRGDKPGGRFLETVRVHCPRVELVAEARVSTRTDPYLADYLLDGRTVLPPAIGLEAMAQAAAALAGRRCATWLTSRWRRRSCCPRATGRRRCACARCSGTTESRRCCVPRAPASASTTSGRSSRCVPVRTPPRRLPGRTAHRVAAARPATVPSGSASRWPCRAASWMGPMCTARSVSSAARSAGSPS